MSMQRRCKASMNKATLKSHNGSVAGMPHAAEGFHVCLFVQQFKVALKSKVPINVAHPHLLDYCKIHNQSALAEMQVPKCTQKL